MLSLQMKDIEGGHAVELERQRVLYEERLAQQKDLYEERLAAVKTSYNMDLESLKRLHNAELGGVEAKMEVEKRATAAETKVQEATEKLRMENERREAENKLLVDQLAHERDRFTTTVDRDHRYLTEARQSAHVMVEHMRTGGQEVGGIMNRVVSQQSQLLSEAYTSGRGGVPAYVMMGRGWQSGSGQGAQRYYETQQWQHPRGGEQMFALPPSVPYMGGQGGIHEMQQQRQQLALPSSSTTSQQDALYNQGSGGQQGGYVVGPAQGGGGYVGGPGGGGGYVGGPGQGGGGDVGGPGGGGGYVGGPGQGGGG